MDIKLKRRQAAQRSKRTRAQIKGTSKRPRLCVFRSLKHISVQLIDDAAGKTLVASSDLTIKKAGKKGVEVAALVGTEVAKKATDAGISSVVFDRGPYRYHGRIKALAEAAREGGLKF
ncbi:MAG: 50S ribosomal protein L18 [Patescibacteria group bacterium]